MDAIPISNATAAPKDDVVNQPIVRKNSRDSRSSHSSRGSRISQKVETRLSSLETSMRDIVAILSNMQGSNVVPKNTQAEADAKTDTKQQVKPKSNTPAPASTPARTTEDGIIFPTVINEEVLAEDNANYKHLDESQQEYDSYFMKTFPATQGNPLGIPRRDSVLLAMGKERRPPLIEQPISEEERIEKNSRNMEKALASLVNALDGRNPVKFKPQASYDDIRLSSLKVKAIFEFYKKVEEYESRHGVEIPLGMQLDERIRKRICSHNNYNGRDSDFFALSKEDVFEHIRQVIKPNTTHDFSAKLNSTLTFELPPKFTLNMESYRFFHVALKTYMKLFKEVFVYLSYKNEEAIPAIDNKQVGIITVFCANVPFGFAYNVCNNLRITSCKKLSEFFSKFTDITERLNELSIEISKYRSYFVLTKMPAMDKSLEKFASDKAEEGVTSKSKGKYGHHQRSLLNRIELDDLEDNFDLNMEELTTSDVTMDLDRDPESELDIPNERDNTMNIDELKSDPIMDFGELQSFLDQIPEFNSADESTTNLNAIPEILPRGTGKLYDPYRKDTATSLVSKNSTGSTQSKACFAFMANGKCDRPNCPYSHSRADCESQVKYLKDVIAKAAWTKPQMAKANSNFSKSV